MERRSVQGGGGDSFNNRESKKTKSAKEQISQQIEELKQRNRSIIEDIQKQNEYDISRGREIGEFREKLALSLIAANTEMISQLEKKLIASERKSIFERTLTFLMEPIIQRQKSSSFTRYMQFQRQQVQGKDLVKPDLVTRNTNLYANNNALVLSKSEPELYSPCKAQEDVESVSASGTASVSTVTNKENKEAIQRIVLEINELRSVTTFIKQELAVTEEYERSKRGGRSPSQARGSMAKSKIEANERILAELNESLQKLQQQELLVQQPEKQQQGWQSFQISHRIRSSTLLAKRSILGNGRK